MENKKLMYFYTDTCPACRVSVPELEAARKSMGDDVSVEKINAAENDAAHHYGVRSVPTFIFLRDGTEAERITGAARSDDIIAAAARAFGF